MPVYFNKQVDAFKDASEKRNSIIFKNTLFKFSSIKNNKQFAKLILSTKPDKRHFYELLREGRQQLMFADIDGPQITDISDVKKYISKLRKLLRAEFKKQRFSNSKFSYSVQYERWLINSDFTKKSFKLSLHFLYLNAGFKNSDHQKKFWKGIENKILSNDEFSILRKNDKKTIIDLVVYSKNRALRTIYSSKKIFGYRNNPRGGGKDVSEKKEVKEEVFLLPLEMKNKPRILGNVNITEYFVNQKPPNFIYSRN